MLAKRLLSQVLELGNFSRFPNPKHIMAYIGLTPPRYHRYAKRLQRSGRKGANGVER
ncbi:transposase [Enterobacter asburiae]|nr:transposase [Enterobacter asburiae]MBL5956834.1 transposase [Enterobacter asburiae]